jgi:RNA polymerase sigma-70 factor (ECF subfamily)
MGTTNAIENMTSSAATQTLPDDMSLVNACKRGDAAAFEKLVKRYDRRLLSIAQHVTHNGEDARDVVREAFLKVFRDLIQVRENSQFSTWLIRITVKESLMKLHKCSTGEVSRNEGFHNERDIARFGSMDWTRSSEQLNRGSGLRNILGKAIQELQPSLRVVFVLHDIEGLSTEHTAEILELTAVAVKTRLLRARLQLRESLRRYFVVE